MTANKKLKRKIRSHMAETGLNYTAARAHFVASNLPADDSRTELTPSSPTAFERARAEHLNVVRRFISSGRLRSIPTKRKTRAHVLLALVELFEPGCRYTEKEVNTLLAAAHPDTAYLRRELVNYGYLRRASGTYCLPASVPERSGILANEIPDWEGLWLPTYLAGHAR